MDIAAVRKAIAQKLGTLNIHAYSYAPDQPTAPAAYVYPQPFDYDGTFDGGVELKVVVRYLVQSTVTAGGQDQIDGFISPSGATSGKVKIEADQTLNGTCSSVRVTGVRNYGAVDIANQTSTVRYFSAEQLLSVFA